MKRFAVIGALVLILAMFAGPAFASDRGSVLPAPGTEQVLPQSSGSASSGSNGSYGGTQYATGGLADTGLGLTNGAVLAAGLLVLGGAAVTLGRRRRAGI